MSEIATNLLAIRGQIAAACERSGRHADEVKLVAVSKTHPPELLSEAINAGVIALGENKVQEAEGKIEELGANAAEWHLIGHLQANKARKAVRLFDVIQTIDTAELAERLDRICEEEGVDGLRVLIQADLAGEATKAGCPEAEIYGLAEKIAELNRVRLTGLMVLPPYFDDAEQTRPYFRRLREIRDRLASRRLFGSGKGELSMGMSHDFKVAIEEGATIVRVGTAIFGSR